MFAGGAIVGCDEWMHQMEQCKEEERVESRWKC
jgi:hypothetical protein